jgi:hypothetical protein
LVSLETAANDLPLSKLTPWGMSFATAPDRHLAARTWVLTTDLSGDLFLFHLDWDGNSPQVGARTKLGQANTSVDLGLSAAGDYVMATWAQLASPAFHISLQPTVESLQRNYTMTFQVPVFYTDVQFDPSMGGSIVYFLTGTQAGAGKTFRITACDLQDWLIGAESAADICTSPTAHEMTLAVASEASVSLSRSRGDTDTQLLRSRGSAYDLFPLNEVLEGSFDFTVGPYGANTSSPQALALTTPQLKQLLQINGSTGFMDRIYFLEENETPGLEEGVSHAAVLAFVACETDDVTAVAYATMDLGVPILYFRYSYNYGFPGSPWPSWSDHQVVVELHAVPRAGNLSIVWGSETDSETSLATVEVSQGLPVCCERLHWTLPATSLIEPRCLLWQVFCLTFSMDLALSRCKRCNGTSGSTSQPCLPA